MADSTSLLFHTAQGDFCPTTIVYEELSYPELETLVQKTRDATLKLEAELEKRQSATLVNPLKPIKEYVNKLRISLESIKTIRRLDSREAKSIEIALSELMTEQTIRGAKIYQDFLKDIIRHCGPGLALLCAASLGKWKIAHMNAQTRTDLVHYLTSMKASFYSSDLDTLATEYKFPFEIGTPYTFYTKTKC